MIKQLACVAAAALATGAAVPASAATFLGDNVVVKRVQGGSVFKTVSTSVGSGFEYTDNFFGVDISANEVLFKAVGGNFSLGDISYEISGLDFDDKPGTPNLIENFAASQIFNGNLKPIDGSRATILPSGTFRMSFANTIGGNSGFARITFGAPPITGAVPEPATWAMMIAGFGLVGGAMRRQRRWHEHRPTAAPRA
jgi:hypothetical protein